MRKDKSEITLIIGGSRSGKSLFAERLAAENGRDVTYLATGKAIDAEMSARIADHQRQRPKSWRTIEVERELIDDLRSIDSSGQTLLIDCLTIYVAGLLGDEQADIDDIEEHFNKLYRELKKGANKVLIVTNEVGNGLVPPYPLGRRYRDVLGRVNQISAAAADEVYMMVAGIPVKIKG